MECVIDAFMTSNASKLGQIRGTIQSFDILRKLDRYLSFYTIVQIYTYIVVHSISIHLEVPSIPK